jgi:hypothetical protein
LQQQGVSAEDLKALLEADDESESTTAVPAIKQVAEQHKIMAMHRARKLLEDSLGRTFVPPKPLDLMDRPRPSYKPNLVLPELRPRTQALVSLEARQKCLIPPNVPINISMEENNPILIDPSDEPAVQMGGLVPEGSVATRGTIVVRCQACSTGLRVSLKATLVRCPTCRELSPASDRPQVATEVSINM